MNKNVLTSLVRNAGRGLFLVLFLIVGRGVAPAWGQPIGPVFWWYHYCNLSHSNSSGQGVPPNEVLEADTCDQDHESGNCISTTARVHADGTETTILQMQVRLVDPFIYEATLNCPNGNTVACRGTLAEASPDAVECWNDDPPPQGLVAGTTRKGCR